jgi:transposase
MVMDLRSMIRCALGRRGQPSAAVLEGRTLQSSCESGPRSGCDGYKRKRGSKVHIAVDTLGHLLAVHVTPANEQKRAQVLELCDAVQTATGHSVKLAWADQGYTGEQPRQNAQAHGIKLAETKKGFVLLPRRWVVERSFAWTARFRRLSRDYERLPDVLRGLHFVVFAILMLPKVVPLLMAAGSSQHVLGVKSDLESAASKAIWCLLYESRDIGKGRKSTSRLSPKSTKLAITASPMTNPGSPWPISLGPSCKSTSTSV